MILKILSLLLLIVFVRAAFSLFRLFNNVRKAADQMTQQLNGSFRNQQSNTANDRETVYETTAASPQKIIPREEGEYVDYEDITH